MNGVPHAAPRVTIVLPCHNEAEFLPSLLDALLPQLLTQPGWQLVAVDDNSTDATGSILDHAADRDAQVRVIHGLFGSPGAARAAGTAAVTILGHGAPPDWLLTIDCDVEIPADFVSGWHTRIAEVHGDESIGALNGGEDQQHLYDGLPNAQRAAAKFGAAAGRSEAAVGIVNLNGVNHAVRTTAYLTAGPYEQPMIVGPDGEVNLAGEDWDLGVRLRLAGFRIDECAVTVRDRGRRLLADVTAYLTGEAYEGEFRRVHATGARADIDEPTAIVIGDNTVDRVLVHFFFKILLADPSLIHTDIGLSAQTVAAMRAWIARWPSPTFTQSRHGFVYGRLPRFAAAFTSDVRQQLGLARGTADPHAPQEH